MRFEDLRRTVQPGEKRSAIRPRRKVKDVGVHVGGGVKDETKIATEDLAANDDDPRTNDAHPHAGRERVSHPEEPNVGIASPAQLVDLFATVRLNEHGARRTADEP
jgi:hypothetical protein